jgi:hypothetical protein
MKMDKKIFSLSEDYNLYHADLKEKKYYLFNTVEGTYFNLNEVAFDMLSLFDGKKKVSEVENKLKNMYNISEAKLKDDLLTLVDIWIREKILIAETKHE